MSQQTVKVIGANGQVSLGKEFAGKTILVDQVSAGTWIIKIGVFIPDSEKWLYEGSNMAKLEKAIEWTEKHKPIDNFDQLAKKIKDV
jgi:hypothetical protein